MVHSAHRGKNNVTWQGQVRSQGGAQCPVWLWTLLAIFTESRQVSSLCCCPLQNWFSHIFTAKSSQIIIWTKLCFNFRASLAWGEGDVLVQFLQSPDSVYKSLVKKGMTFLLLIFLNRQNMKQKMDNLRGREKTEWWKHELECCDMPDIHGSYMGVLFRSIHE